MEENPTPQTETTRRERGQDNVGALQDSRIILGKNIRRRRRAMDVSQEKFAELCGLHRSYYAGIERGERNPSFDNLVKIARALGVALAEVVEGVF